VLKKNKVTFIVMFLLLIVNLSSCGNNDTSSKTTNYIPIIFYTADSTKEVKDTTTAIKINFNITTKKLEKEPAEIFSFENSSQQNYQ
jgi:hypothetical protein